MFGRFVSQRGTGPAALFALIERPRRAYFPAQVSRHPWLYSSAFILTLMVLTVAFVLSQLGAAVNDAPVDLLPTEAAIVLLIGVALFPMRMIAIPILGFILVCLTGFLMKLWLEPGYVPADIAPWTLFSLTVLINGVVAVVSALAGRVTVNLLGPKNRWADATLSAATTVVYLLLSTITIWVMTHSVYPSGWTDRDFGSISLTEVAWIRAYRIAACSGVLLLFLLDVPSWPAFRRALMPLPVFVAAAIAEITGHGMHATADVALISLVVALVLPGYSAILANILGLIAYISLTGAGLIQEPINTRDAAALEMVSLVVMTVNYVLMVVRHQSDRGSRRTRETMARVQRVHAFATIGYFIFDVNRARVHVDEVAAEILGTGDQFDANAFVDRVRPADRGGLVSVMADRYREATLTAFSLAPGAQWQDGAKGIRHVAIYSWYERLWDGRTIAYGALLDRTDEHDRSAALGKALADLSEQQNRQTQLFSIVSHEIRTPASVISMLVEEIDGGASWAQMGPRLKAVSEQLLSVLADMRQTVRPEENLPIRMEPFRPQDLAETVRNTFLLMAEARGVDLVLNLSSGADQDRVSDRVRLNQVLSNLVKNALIHAECRRITISYAEESADGQLWAVWRVSDDGRGIPPAERGRLFLPFSRITATGHARTDGSGLGLFVTKTSIELLGGSVDYRDAPAGGSDFVIRVPETKGVPMIAPVRLDTAAVSAGFSKALVVEDSDLIGELLVARLQRLVPTVIWARNGLEGIELQASETPDLILTDLFMPKMGGDEMTSALRGQGVSVPIVGMTAAAIGDERTTFENAGTDFVLTKPVSTAQLVEALGRLRQPAA
jgi:two-component system, sensor histidine kinase